jgi:hypothetical protein
LLEIWMSMLGLKVGTTSVVVMMPLSKKRARMSLLLVPTTKCEIGRPICFAA